MFYLFTQGEKIHSKLSEHGQGKNMMCYSTGILRNSMAFLFIATYKHNKS